MRSDDHQFKLTSHVAVIMTAKLPPFAPFAPPSFRREIIPEEWEACLDSWITLAQAHLRLPTQTFIKASENERSGLIPFLTTYMEQVLNTPVQTLHGTPSELSLRKETFLLTHRLLSLNKPPEILLKQSFLSNLSRTFSKSHELQKLLSSLWKRKGSVIEQDLQKSKEVLIKDLDGGNLDAVNSVIKRLAPLLHCSPDAASFFMVGSDLLDSIVAVYPKISPAVQKSLTLFTYLGLVSLISGDKPNLSLLSDHLYSLKSSNISKSGEKSLISDLATDTPLIGKIKTSSAAEGAGRSRKLEQLLSEFRQPNTAIPKRLIRRKIDKGKGKATEDGTMHIHRMSLISHIQDLFPDLGSSFITKLLDEYNEDVEQVTAHLLDDSLPPHLQALDRTEQIPPSSFPSTSKDLVPDMIPHSTPPLLPSRRNIFDNDEFDQLAVDTSKLHIGRKNAKLTADAVLADRSTAPNKAAILSALAAFDSDDDERDDTYDIEDVGGTVDSTSANNEADIDKNEEALFTAYRSSPELFSRDAATRRGQGRAALKLETGMTDEAIEGWGIMIQRDPRRLRRLEARYATFTGQQQNLERTAYRGSPTGSGGEEEQDGGFAGRGGRGRGRGGYRGGGRGRGGIVAGPSGEVDTLVARQKKEANKGSRANHNRRDQRAKKMARGGFPG
jgi:activating signal cointegrator complex subunit 2